MSNFVPFLIEQNNGAVVRHVYLNVKLIASIVPGADDSHCIVTCGSDAYLMPFSMVEIKKRIEAEGHRNETANGTFLGVARRMGRWSEGPG